MESLDYIDSFFNNQLSPAEKQDFDRRIQEDPAFASEVAFYVSARKVAQDQSATEKKARFKEIFASQPPMKKTGFLKSLNPYLIAASVLFAVLFTWFIDHQKSQTQTLAQGYIKENLVTLGVTMSNQQDSMQLALKLYNDKDYTKSDSLFEKMLKSDPRNFNALKYAGLAELNAGEHEKALDHFQQLAAEKSLFANPGKFYQALTLMKRDAEGDREKVKKLLRQVVDEGLEGKETATDWLTRL